MKAPSPWLFLQILTITLSGCWSNPLGLYDEGTCRSYSEIPPVDELVGVYEPDSTSLVRLQALDGDGDREWSIEFDSSKTFNCSAFPWRTGRDVFEFDTLLNVTGHWSIEQYRARCSLVLMIDGVTNYSGIHVCKANGVPRFFLSAGDPDAGDQIIYAKRR